jgi:hypothetical protein
VQAPHILAIGTANPLQRFTQEEVFRMAGYSSQRILEIFLNSDIDSRCLYIDPRHFSRNETPDQLNQRYLRGAMETGCLAVQRCLESAGLSSREAPWAPNAGVRPAPGGLGAKFLLKEQVSKTRWAGMLLVAAGVALVCAAR